MLGTEATPSDKEWAEPTHNRQHLLTMGSWGIAWNRYFPRERAHFWVGLDPPSCGLRGWALPLSQVVAPCTSLVELQSMEVLDHGL